MSTGIPTPWGGTALILGFPKAVAKRLGDSLSGLDYEGLTAQSSKEAVRTRAKLPESENLHLFYKGRLSVVDAIQDTSVHVLARVTSKFEDPRSTSYVLEVLAARPDESYEALIHALQADQTMDRL